VHSNAEKQLFLRTKTNKVRWLLVSVTQPPAKPSQPLITMKYKIVVRIKGGLGNQMFCYAAARSLALRNNAKLVIDNVTGFVRDKTYNRKYALDVFNIPCRLATPSEYLAPFERYRRGLLKYLSRKQDFFKRKYVEQERKEFDPRLLSYKVKKNIIIDGLWLSEKYFKDYEQNIRKDLTFREPDDRMNQQTADSIRSNPQAVSLHVRWYATPDEDDKDYNLRKGYYLKAIQYIKQKIDNPVFYIFSDFPEHVDSIFKDQLSNYSIILHNKDESMAYADMWLMSLCRHHIIANSTFSWWGAWLNPNKEKVVVVPPPSKSDIYAWGFEGQIPDEWIVLS
jgi:hypothetical protein